MDAEVVVVGAGPAGLAAAALLPRYDADVVLVDEQRAPGGQIWRQPPPELGPPGRDGLAEIDSVTRASIRRAQQTTAWGIFGTVAPLDPFGGGREAGVAVAVAGPDGIDEIGARRVLLAPGAYDLPVAFPGWTLPGVMGAGAVQSFLKSQRLLPGRRFALVGAHPLLLTIGDQLLRAGGEIAVLALATTPPGPGEALRAVPAVAGNVRALAEGARALRSLRRAGVPVELRHMIVRAEGQGEVEAVIVAEVDADWRVRAGSERPVECDTVALGFGFVPSTELAQQAGCAVRWDGPAGGWIVSHDAWMRTTRPELFAAGEITGIAGADQAAEEGRLAALGILRDLGRLTGADARRLARPVRRRLWALRRFTSEVQRSFAPRHAALARLLDPGTVVCRCEEITLAELETALAENPHLGTADAVKLLTRAGMGPCQGRMCAGVVSQVVAAATGRSVEEVGTYKARPPAKPLALDALARAADV